MLLNIIKGISRSRTQRDTIYEYDGRWDAWLGSVSRIRLIGIYVPYSISRTNYRMSLQRPCSWSTTQTKRRCLTHSRYSHLNTKIYESIQLTRKGKLNRIADKLLEE